jgi:ABC-type glucose/galactose transport system permease subunit
MIFPQANIFTIRRQVSVRILTALRVFGGLMIQGMAMLCSARIVHIASQEANKARVLPMEVFHALCIPINAKSYSSEKLR